MGIITTLRESIAENRKEVQRAKRDRTTLKRQRGGVKAKRPTLRRVLDAGRLVRFRQRRLAARRARLAALEVGGLRDALRWAMSVVGTRETGYNRGPLISDMIIAGGGEPGYPYCAYGVERFMREAGLPQFMGGLADMFRVWGINRTNGFRIVSYSDRRAGDLVTFDWNRNGSADHIGVYIGDGKTWECNTSPGSSGSQNDGEGIWIRERGPGFVLAVIRPPYRR